MRRRQRKKNKRAATATAATTPITIPAMAPPDIEELALVSGEAVADAEGVIEAEADAEAEAEAVFEDVGDAVDGASEAESDSVVFCVTSNERICLVASWLDHGHGEQV